MIWGRSEGKHPRTPIRIQERNCNGAGMLAGETHWDTGREGKHTGIQTQKGKYTGIQTREGKYTRTQTQQGKYIGIRTQEGKYTGIAVRRAGRRLGRDAWGVCAVRVRGAGGGDPARALSPLRASLRPSLTAGRPAADAEPEPEPEQHGCATPRPSARPALPIGG